MECASRCDDTVRERHGLARLDVPIEATFALVAGVIGLALLPLSVACLRREILGRALAIFVGVATCLMGLWAVGLRYPQPLMSGAVWSFRELGGTTALVPDDPAAAVPMAVRMAALAIGAASFAIALAVMSAPRGTGPSSLATTGRSPNPGSLWTRWSAWAREDAGRAFLTWAFLGHAALIALVWLLYDRYALVLVPFGIAILLAARPRVNRIVAVCGLTCFLLLSLVGIRDHLSYNRALWRAVDVLRRSRAPRSETNGGYVVNGWLQYAHPEHAHLDSEGRVSVPWVNSGESLPYRISNAAPPGWDEIGRVPYTRWLASSGSLFVLHRASPPGGRPAPAANVPAGRAVP